jgi:hypothetical protein
MSELLIKLTFGITVTATVGFYYLAAAPPALAQTSVCGVGNYSPSCRTDGSRLIPPQGQPTVAPTSQNLSTVYVLPNQKTTAVPEPGTVIGVLVIGAGMMIAGKKRKNISEEP